jgi:hypothetical protein
MNRENKLNIKVHGYFYIYEKFRVVCVCISRLQAIKVWTIMRGSKLLMIRLKFDHNLHSIYYKKFKYISCFYTCEKYKVTKIKIKYILARNYFLKWKITQTSKR